MKCNILKKNINLGINDENSYIRIDNYGAYIMRFTIIYYFSPEEGIVVKSDDFSAGEGVRLEYPNNVLKVRLIAEVEVFIEVYETFVDQTFTTTEKRCYEAYGATVNPYLVQKECPMFDNSYFNVLCIGFVVCRFNIIYTTPDGQITTLDSGDIYIGQNRTLYYPPNITSVRFILKVAQFFGIYKTFLDKTYTTPDRRCFTVAGPVADPDIRQEKCTV